MPASEWAPGAVALCAGAALAGYVYWSTQALAREADAEAAKEQALKEKAAAAAKAPARASPPLGTASTEQQHPGKAAAADGNNSCAHCGAAPDSGRRLLVCTRCRGARYCSNKCQAAAWATHRHACNKARAAAGTSTTPTSNNSATSSPTAAAAVAAADKANEKDQLQGEKQQPSAKKQQPNGQPQRERGEQQQQQQQEELDEADVLDVLGGLVQRSADGRSDALQGAFESAVVLFVKGDAAGAAPALQEVATRAAAAGRPELAAEALRWLGHAHNRCGAAARAAAAFAEGAAVAAAAGAKRLQVECLSGLGVAHRSQGQAAAAVGFLRQALAVADTMGTDPAGLSARGGVLTNLGTTLVQVDADEACKVLTEAVALREQQVVKLHAAGERNGLATAIMEQANALFALAGALYGTSRYSEARDAYTRALEVFELVGDGERVAVALVNLANLHELQLDSEPESLQRAAEYRERAFAIGRRLAGRDAPAACAICTQAIDPLKPTPRSAEAAPAAAGKAAAAAAAEEPAAEIEPAEPEAGAAPTEGKGDEEAERAAAAEARAGRMLLLPCLHCYHRGCFVGLSPEDGAPACPSCKPPATEEEAATAAAH